MDALTQLIDSTLVLIRAVQDHPGSPNGHVMRKMLNECETNFEELKRWATDQATYVGLPDD